MTVKEIYNKIDTLKDRAIELKKLPVHPQNFLADEYYDRYNQWVNDYLNMQELINGYDARKDKLENSDEDIMINLDLIKKGFNSLNDYYNEILRRKNMIEHQRIIDQLPEEYKKVFLKPIVVSPVSDEKTAKKISNLNINNKNNSSHVENNIKFNDFVINIEKNGKTDKNNIIFNESNEKVSGVPKDKLNLNTVQINSEKKLSVLLKEMQDIRAEINKLSERFDQTAAIVHSMVNASEINFSNNTVDINRNNQLNENIDLEKRKQEIAKKDESTQTENIFNIGSNDNNVKINIDSEKRNKIDNNLVNNDKSNSKKIKISKNILSKKKQYTNKLQKNDNVLQKNDNASTWHNAKK